MKPDSAVRAQNPIRMASRWLARLSAATAKFAEWTSVVSLLLMTVLVSAQVVLRYVLGKALPWAEEAAVYMMVWMAFIGAAVALRQGEHIALSLVVERLPAALARAIKLISHVLVLIFVCLVLGLAVQLATSITGQRSPALGIDMFLPYLILPLGCLFMAIETMNKIMSPDPHNVQSP